ncbi:MAG: ABC transporter permease [Deltaproteobacteria bacterium]|nr:ABC transporter permease [Deltaproteobacteria bacterium]MDZ4345111.1 ABC transporter permease [Candidatus Binatia bacterium]
MPPVPEGHSATASNGWEESRRHSTRGRYTDKYIQVGWCLGFVGLLLTFWQAATYVFAINPYILPSPLAIGHTLIVSMGFLTRHMLVTLAETLLGFALASVVGVLLAMVLAHFRRLREASYPVLIFVQTTPKVALAPVLLVWFGYGWLPKLAMTFLAAFFPILINTMAGLTNIDEELIYLTRILGASSTQIYRKVRLRNALPFMFAGFKVGMTLAIIGALVAEFVSADRGLGYIIVTAQGQFRTDLAFAAIFLLAVIGLGLFYLLEAAEKFLLPWVPRDT